jgi:hypothetical protein
MGDWEGVGLTGSKPAFLGCRFAHTSATPFLPNGAPCRMVWDDTLLWKSPGGECGDLRAPSVDTKGAQPSWL